MPFVAKKTSVFPQLNLIFKTSFFIFLSVAKKDSALNLPDEVPDSLLSLQVNLHNDEEIVPMEGCLQPSQTSPEQPKPDLFKGVMLDVAKNPREITTAETTGEFGSLVKTLESPVNPG